MRQSPLLRLAQPNVVLGEACAAKPRVSPYFIAVSSMEQRQQGGDGGHAQQRQRGPAHEHKSCGQPPPLARQDDGEKLPHDARARKTAFACPDGRWSNQNLIKYGNISVLRGSRFLPKIPKNISGRGACLSDI